PLPPAMVTGLAQWAWRQPDGRASLDGTPMRRLACTIALACVAGSARADLPPPWLGAFGQYGYGDGEFRHPGALAVDRDGNVYVADESNQRVEKFTARGGFIFE